MAVLDDIETLKTLQDQFRSDHGEYFEIVYDNKAPIPNEGDDLNITSLTRFLQDNDVVTGIKDILFTPTAKDFQFIVGKGTRKDDRGNVTGRVYMITAQRRLQPSGVIDRYQAWEGDSPLKEMEL